MADREMFARIWALCAAIPRGKTATYGQLAWLSGHPGAARQAGRAMRYAPAGLPCHRVIRSDGSLAPGDAFGVPGLQRRMLEDEGVPFLEDGRVDLRACRWEPETHLRSDTD